MKQLKTLLVEDEENDELLLRTLFQKHPGVIEFVATARSFAEACTLLANEKFDLSILDYWLNDNTDLLDLINTVGTQNMGIVTLSSKKRIGSYKDTQKLGAYLYIGKPFSERGIAKFITELKERVEQEKANSNGKYVIRGAKNENFHLTDSDIYVVQGGASCTTYHCRERGLIPAKIVRSCTLHEAEAELNSKVFLRCHKSYIVNCTYIQKSQKDGDGGDFSLENKTQIPYTETYKKELRQRGLID